ncbi:MAG: UPF0489 family protein [Patescibacteria group bacterium]|nr:UPF0489 family protein [Patescibacteria group bacterium]
MAGDEFGSTGKETIYPSSYDSNGLSLYYKDEAVGRSLNCSRLTRSRPLRIGGVNDLQLVDINQGLDWYHVDPPTYALKNYIRTVYGKDQTPSYIFDDHNHAIFAWYEARAEGRVCDGAFLFRVDEHSDGRKSVLSFSPRPSLKDVAELAKALDFDDFNSLPQQQGLVGEICWVSPWHHTGIQNEPETQGTIGYYMVTLGDILDKILTERLPREKVIVDIDLDYLDHVDEIEAIKLLKEIMEMSGVNTISLSPGCTDPFLGMERVKKIFNLKE